jgi:hypothetical protein
MTGTGARVLETRSFLHAHLLLSHLLKHVPECTLEPDGC